MTWMTCKLATAVYPFLQSILYTFCFGWLDPH